MTENENGKMTGIEKVSLFVTGGTAAGMAILASYSVHFHWILWIAVSVGALGGVAHEIAQSGGKIAFFRKEEDGMYLGTLAGAVLGAVAGVLVVRGHMTNGAPGGVISINMSELSYEVFTAGLALKGVVEAAGGNVVPKKKPGASS